MEVRIAMKFEVEIAATCFATVTAQTEHEAATKALNLLDGLPRQIT
jgi:hypothetical protein